jgi:hypothetical protein
MANQSAHVSHKPTVSMTLWSIVLLEHLDEFATLAWYLVADGRLVEDTFSRTLATLDTISFKVSIPERTYSQARDVLIAQAIAVVSDKCIETSGDWSVEPDSVGGLPDLARLAFMLKLIIGSHRADRSAMVSLSRYRRLRLASRGPTQLRRRTLWGVQYNDPKLQ